jgi:hypothetical protein
MVPWVVWGYNRENHFYMCLYWKKSLKTLFYKTSSPISIKRDKKYPCIKRIKVCTNRGPDHIQRGDTCNCKNRMRLCNFFFLRTTVSESSDLHKSYLIKCKLKYCKIMILRGHMGPQFRKTGLHIDKLNIL